MDESFPIITIVLVDESEPKSIELSLLIKNFRALPEQNASLALEIAPLVNSQNEMGIIQIKEAGTRY